MNLTSASAPAAPGCPAAAKPWTTHRTGIVAALLWLATVGLFLPVRHFDFIDFDDDEYVTADQLTQSGFSLASFKHAWVDPVSDNWHPLTILSHELDCQLYGLDAGAHHVTNLLFHALNVVLVFLLFCRLTGAFWRSACVAALFGWHPLHVESVAWIAERKDVLSACFGLLGLLAYVRHARESGTPGAGRAWAFVKSVPYWLALGCFFAGLLSKPVLVTWPFVLLLLDYWPLERFQPGCRWRLLAEKIPFFVLTVVISLTTYLVHKRTGDMKMLESLPFALRFENALIAYVRYLGKTIWPVDLAPFYPHPGHWPMGEVLLAGALLAGLTGWVWVRRTRRPYLVTGWFWFAGTLVPMIGLVQVGRDAIADRYTYLAHLGLFTMLVWGAAEAGKRWGPGRLVLAGLAAAVLLGCGVATRQQLGYWQNSETLFRHALAVTPDNDVARNNLGTALLVNGQTNAAIEDFRQAIRLKADCVDAYYNLGQALRKAGDPDGSMANYRKAIQLRPAFYQAHYNLGTELSEQGQTNEAISELAEAIRYRLNDFEAHRRLGVLLAGRGQTNEAAGEFEAAIWLKPDDAEAHYDLGCLLAKSGKAAAAIGEFEADLRLNTNDVEGCYKLGNLLAKTGQKEEAMRCFQQAVRLKPGFAEAHNNLGSLLSARGDVAEAIGQFQDALRAKPDYVDAHYNLGHAWLKKGDSAAAIEEFKSVVQLSPNFAPAYYYLGVALVSAGRAEEALASFQQALRLRPNDAMTRNQLGLVLAGKGEADEAVAQFQEALRLKPDYTEASNNLVRVRQQRGGSAPH